MAQPIRILSISGSLREASSNTALLLAAARLAPEGVDVELYDGLGDLPHFNPDIEDAPIPAVLDYRAKLQAADGLLISSPEYAHGVPGSLKNALDWVVGSGELVYKPVALLNASPRSTYAQSSLTETLTVMTAALVPEATITIPLQGRKLDPGGIASAPDLADPLRVALAAFARAIEARRA
jgi:NAD(P)H-dependent FMN reductase